MTFVGCSISGLLLILAPEEPSLKLGGGADYALFPGAVLIALAIFAVIISLIGCLSVASDSRVGLCCVRNIYMCTWYCVCVYIVAVSPAPGPPVNNEYTYLPVLINESVYPKTDMVYKEDKSRVVR